MPYADRETQLQYLKDRRKKLRVGRKVNYKPYEEPVLYPLSKPLAPAIDIKPFKNERAYNPRYSIEKQKPIDTVALGLQPAEYIFV